MAHSGYSPNSILIETAKVTLENLPDALAVLQGCWKSSTILWMHASGFPALPGLILGGWSDKSEPAVERFCRAHGVSELLVRIEKPSQRWTRRRGGYTIPAKQTRSLVEGLASEGMITILLEPANPNSDLLSLTCVSEVDNGKIDVEVVGPGFDASDILRADVAPHERFEITFESNSALVGARKALRTNRTYVIEQGSYQASVRRRLAKIGARLRNPSFPEESMPTASTPDALEGLIEMATQYLRESRQTTLLDHADRYDPVPPRLLDMFLEQVLRLSQTVAESRVSWRTFSLAGSFLSNDRLVIWDFFPPGDHDTRSLSDLRLPLAR